MPSPSSLRRVKAAIVALLGAAACRQPASAPVPMTAPVRLVPAPASLALNDAPPFAIGATTTIVALGGAEVTQIADYLAGVLRPSTGQPLPVAAGGAPSIQLAVRADLASLGEEGYQLRVTNGGVQLAAFRPAGLFRGVQTLRQLLPPEVESHFAMPTRAWMIPALEITDRPRFVWRGAMLDVARHFFTVREVEQFIDLLALYKMNVLHLHLADDQGWRIEIASRPKLTQAGSVTQVGGGSGGFYTQQEYAEIVRYAQARYITIVPEIDMPGHSNAALIAYPELSCGKRVPGPYAGTEVGWSTFCVDKEETYVLVDDVVREIAALTPGAYFHMGGDEVMTLTHDQYTKFVERVQDIVAAHGKQMVGWEEIAKARLRPTTIAQQWKSDSVTAAVASGARILLSPAKHAYLDMKYAPTTELGLRWAGLVDVRDAYDWDPGTSIAGVTEAQMVGVEAPIWSETLRNITAVEYLAVPRLPAIAELGWTPQASRGWEDFRSRLAAQAPRWNHLGINWYRSPQIEW